MRAPLTIVLCVMSGVACRKAAPEVSSAVLADVNALVPEAHRSKLAFTSRTVDVPGKRGLRYVVAAPKDWRASKSDPDTLRSPQNPETHLSLRSSCLNDGLTLPTMLNEPMAADRTPCAPRDWEALAETKIKTDFLEVLKVEKGPNRRTIFATGGVMNPDARTVTVLWWEPNGSEMFSCYARLEGAVETIDAFARACASVVVTRL